MMTQLTTLDAGLRNVQDASQHADLAVGAVAIVHGKTPDFTRFESLLAERIQSIPQCKQVLRTEWIDYPGFDLTQHLRRVALPSPGDKADLFRTIAHALESPLDLDRPPWECWIIEGIKGHRWAILVKIHHCMATSISPAHILARLSDDADEYTFASHHAVTQLSSPRADLNGWPNVLRQAPAAAINIVKAAARVVTGAAEAAVEAVWPAAWTTPTTMRRYTMVRVPRAAVDSVCQKFAVTANDVSLAAITEGFRMLLLRRGEQPRADSLPTLERPGNRVAAILPYLPVEHDDPIQRLQTVHNRLNQTTRSDRRHAGDIVDQTTTHIPFMRYTKVIQALAGIPQRNIVTLATDVPGPRRQLRLMGQRMERILPIPPTSAQLSTGVAVLSYGNELVFGITADHNSEADILDLAAAIELGMARLTALSQDSVLLFTKDRRSKHPSQGLPSNAQRARGSAPSARARN